MKADDTIIATVLQHYPATEGIYLFGSYGTDSQRPDSDIDIAILLPPIQAKETSPQTLNRCSLALTRRLGRPIDLVNARRVSTVFQKEIIAAGRLVYCADQYAVEEFEMLTISYLQKLNEERRGVLRAFAETGRAYAV